MNILETFETTDINSVNMYKERRKTVSKEEFSILTREDEGMLEDPQRDERTKVNHKAKEYALNA